MNGEMPSKEDQLALEERFMPADMERFINNATKIVPTRRLVKEENFYQLKRLGQPIFKIESDDKGETTASAEELFGNVEKNLYLCKGAQVVINKNINPSKGIFNSSTGTIHSIVFEEDKPAYLVIDLDTSKLSKNECFQGVQNRIVVKPITLQPLHSSKSRKQFPVNLAYAMTIHKI